MNPTERPTLIRDVRLFLLLALAAAALSILLLDERSRLRDYEVQIGTFEKKLLEANETVRRHRHVLLPARRRIRNPGLLAQRSLRTVIKEATESAGVTPCLESVDPVEDTREKVARARVSLRGIPLRSIVELIVALRNLSAGIEDREATMRMQGHNVDSWRLDLTLEAPLPAPSAASMAAARGRGEAP